MKPRSTIKAILLKLIAVIFIFNFASSAQQSSTKLNEKLKKVKGEAQKITIKTSSGEFVFEGDEAKKLLKKIKTDNLEKRFKVFMDSDKDSSGKYKKFTFEDSDSDELEFAFCDDEDSNGIKKEIKVEDENGVKKVEVKTTEDGKESIKKYEGKEAEEYLEKMNKEGKMKIKSDSKDGKKKKMIIIEKELKE